jgi:hypothetical protein
VKLSNEQQRNGIAAWHSGCSDSAATDKLFEMTKKKMEK